MPKPGDAGQIVPLVALVLGSAAAFTLVLIHLGAAATNQARAQAAADAAALAAALDGPAAAADLASRNGASLQVIEVTDHLASVVVRLGESGASATGRRLPDTAAGGLDPAMVESLALAAELLGEPIPVVSGYRSPAEQQALWDARHTNPYPVAVPGTSMHERGLAIDVPRATVGLLQGIAPQVGLCQPLPTTDPVHFELCRTTATR